MYKYRVTLSNEALDRLTTFVMASSYPDALKIAENKINNDPQHNRYGDFTAYSAEIIMVHTSIQTL